MKVKSRSQRYQNFDLPSFPKLFPLRILLLFLCSVLATCTIQAQSIQIVAQQKGISIRGMSVVNDSVAWVSGSKGTVGKTPDGGKNWQWLQVPDFEKTDFRDIHAFDAANAVIMGIDTPAVILRTTDGGGNWKTVFESNLPGMFLDAMDFKGENGVVLGDPLKGNFFLGQTADSGKSWNIRVNSPRAQQGEAFFASSGTNIQWAGKDYLYASGGSYSRLFFQNKTRDLPLQHGKSIAGAHSIAINPYFSRQNELFAIVAGGDYNSKNSSDSNCVLVYQNGKHSLRFSVPQKTFHSYKSCILFLRENTLLATGTSGSDISYDNGRTWKHFSDEPFHVCQSSRNGNFILLAGSDGRIGRLNLSAPSETN